MTAHTQFIQICILAEKAHRHFLDMIQSRLDALKVTDLNASRALILINIADREMTTSELMWRDCYVGSNVSYNLKKLIEAGYVDQSRTGIDKRHLLVKLTAKGLDLRSMLIAMNDQAFGEMNIGSLSHERLASCAETLRGLHIALSAARTRPGVVAQP